MLSLFCWVGVKAQVGVTTQESLWTTKKDAKTGKLAIYTAEGKMLSDNLDSIKQLKNNVFIVTKNNLFEDNNGRFGLFDENDSALISPQYESMDSYYNISSGNKDYLLIL